MGKEFSSIYELRDIYSKKEELSQRELLLSRPTLTDYSMLPYIYECFAGTCQPGKPVSPADRMKFLFIALFLYAPSSLAGRKMPDGLRAALSSLFPSLSPCVLSNNKKQAVFFSLFRKVIIVVPLTIILPYFFGINGVMLAEPISNVIGGCASYFTMRHIVMPELKAMENGR